MLTTLAGYRFLITLMAFYLSSSKLTKVGADIKAKREEGYGEGGHEGNRNWIQVISNGGFGTLMCLYYLMSIGDVDHVIDFTARPTGSWMLCRKDQRGGREDIEGKWD
eukprot:TRINITY_DN476_c0_g2_i6.p1 TRINITY_DN476_c0_g2~~TRINITY_DN476_c0_g2_i6.p1  ORF type:complete len:108 (+),score=22.78 TRINITY_DN476_c0_g2_i6:138-461(+)